MSVTDDILRTYRAPRATLRRLITQPRSEGRLLGYALAACLLIFVGQWPRLSREAIETGAEMEVLVGGALFAWVFVMPLVLYLLAWLCSGAMRIAGRPGDGYGARLALFWALLSAAPLWLLYGLMAGLVGPGPGMTIVGGLALAGFLWFWIMGLIEVGRGEGARA